jgi:hypothetical protein
MSWVRAPRANDRDHPMGIAGQLRRDDPLWPGQLAIAAALAVNFVLPSRLIPGPGRLLVVVEPGLLLALLIGSWTRGRAKAVSKEIALAFVSLVTVTNLTALGLLIHFLLVGGHARGTDLVGGGVGIWTTNLLVFAVWYWELDRGGPLRPGEKRDPVMPDFLFPQMQDERYAAPGWTPNFADYLYVSLTNQTAFSPTDSMPLTLRVKLLMGAQGVASLITVGVIIARAVNILGA